MPDLPDRERSHARSAPPGLTPQNHSIPAVSRHALRTGTVRAPKLPDRERSHARSASPDLTPRNHSTPAVSRHALRTGTVRAPKQSRADCS
jgi:hypothetical protein